MNLKGLKESWYKATRERNALPRYIARRWLFGPMERLGLHVVGDHFYEPVPNLRELALNYDESPRALPGHDLSLGRFEAGHAGRLARYGAEFSKAVQTYQFDPGNYYFRGADALSYYCYLRETKPVSVVEVGQGSSTRVALAALDRNAEETGAAAHLTSIDPYTRLLGDSLVPQRITFEQIHQPLQAIPVADVVAWCAGKALLFVDSSHVYKPGSDVWHLMHWVYPQLPPGCGLHVHDVVLPYPWPKDFYLKQKWFWNEQDILEAFLAFNSAFQVTLPVHLLHRDSSIVQNAAAQAAPDLPQRNIGYSFYLERVA